jgi:hypothetical protein
MPDFLFAITRGVQVLVKHTSTVGMFDKVLDQVLLGMPHIISLETRRVNKFKHGDVLIHYLAEEGIVYMCITEQVRCFRNW